MNHSIDVKKVDILKEKIINVSLLIEKYEGSKKKLQELVKQRNKYYRWIKKIYADYQKAEERVCSLEFELQEFQKSNLEAKKTVDEKELRAVQLQQLIDVYKVERKEYGVQKIDQLRHKLNKVVELYIRTAKSASTKTDRIPSWFLEEFGSQVKKFKVQKQAKKPNYFEVPSPSWSNQNSVMSADSGFSGSIASSSQSPPLCSEPSSPLKVGDVGDSGEKQEHTGKINQLVFQAEMTNLPSVNGDLPYATISTLDGPNYEVVVPVQYDITPSPDNTIGPNQYEIVYTFPATSEGVSTARQSINKGGPSLNIRDNTEESQAYFGFSSGESDAEDGKSNGFSDVNECFKKNELYSEACGSIDTVQEELATAENAKESESAVASNINSAKDSANAGCPSESIEAADSSADRNHLTPENPLPAPCEMLVNEKILATDDEAFEQGASQNHLNGNIVATLSIVDEFHASGVDPEVNSGMVGAPLFIINPSDGTVEKRQTGIHSETALTDTDLGESTVDTSLSLREDQSANKVNDTVDIIHDASLNCRADMPFQTPCKKPGNVSKSDAAFAKPGSEVNIVAKSPMAVKAKSKSDSGAIRFADNISVQESVESFQPDEDMDSNKSEDVFSIFKRVPQYKILSPIDSFSKFQQDIKKKTTRKDIPFVERKASPHHAAGMSMLKPQTKSNDSYHLKTDDNISNVFKKELFNSQLVFRDAGNKHISTSRSSLQPRAITLNEVLPRSQSEQVKPSMFSPPTKKSMRTPEKLSRELDAPKFASNGNGAFSFTPENNISNGTFQNGLSSKPVSSAVAKIDMPIRDNPTEVKEIKVLKTAMEFQRCNSNFEGAREAIDGTKADTTCSFGQNSNFNHVAESLTRGQSFSDGLNPTVQFVSSPTENTNLQLSVSFKTALEIAKLLSAGRKKRRTRNISCVSCKYGRNRKSKIKLDCIHHRKHLYKLVREKELAKRQETCEENIPSCPLSQNGPFPQLSQDPARCKNVYVSSSAKIPLESQRQHAQNQIIDFIPHNESLQSRACLDLDTRYCEIRRMMNAQRQFQENLMHSAPAKIIVRKHYKKDASDHNINDSHSRQITASSSVLVFSEGVSDDTKKSQPSLAGLVKIDPGLAANESSVGKTECAVSDFPYHPPSILPKPISKVPVDSMDPVRKSSRQRYVEEQGQAMPVTRKSERKRTSIQCQNYECGLNSLAALSPPTTILACQPDLGENVRKSTRKQTSVSPLRETQNHTSAVNATGDNQTRKVKSALDSIAAVECISESSPSIIPAFQPNLNESVRKLTRKRTSVSPLRETQNHTSAVNATGDNQTRKVKSALDSIAAVECISESSPSIIPAFHPNLNESVRKSTRKRTSVSPLRETQNHTSAVNATGDNQTRKGKSALDSIAAVECISESSPSIIPAFQPNLNESVRKSTRKRTSVSPLRETQNHTSAVNATGDNQTRKGKSALDSIAAVECVSESSPSIIPAFQPNLNESVRKSTRKRTSVSPLRQTHHQSINHKITIGNSKETEQTSSRTHASSSQIRLRSRGKKLSQSDALEAVICESKASTTPTGTDDILRELKESVRELLGSPIDYQTIFMKEFGCIKRKCSIITEAPKKITINSTSRPPLDIVRKSLRRQSFIPATQQRRACENGNLVCEMPSAELSLPTPLLQSSDNSQRKRMSSRSVQPETGKTDSNDVIKSLSQRPIFSPLRGFNSPSAELDSAKPAVVPPPIEKVTIPEKTFNIVADETNPSSQAIVKRSSRIIQTSFPSLVAKAEPTSDNDLRRPIKTESYSLLNAPCLPQNCEESAAGMPETVPLSKPSLINPTSSNEGDSKNVVTSVKESQHPSGQADDVIRASLNALRRSLRNTQSPTSERPVKEEMSIGSREIGSKSQLDCKRQKVPTNIPDSPASMDKISALEAEETVPFPDSMEVCSPMLPMVWSSCETTSFENKFALPRADRSSDESSLSDRSESPPINDIPEVRMERRKGVNKIYLPSLFGDSDPSAKTDDEISQGEDSNALSMSVIAGELTHSRFGSGSSGGHVYIKEEPAVSLCSNTELLPASTWLHSSRKRASTNLLDPPSEYEAKIGRGELSQVSMDEDATVAFREGNRWKSKGELKGDPQVPMLEASHVNGVWETFKAKKKSAASALPSARNKSLTSGQVIPCSAKMFSERAFKEDSGTASSIVALPCLDSTATSAKPVYSLLKPHLQIPIEDGFIKFSSTPAFKSEAPTLLPTSHMYLNESSTSEAPKKPKETGSLLNDIMDAMKKQEEEIKHPTCFKTEAELPVVKKKAKKRKRKGKRQREEEPPPTRENLPALHFANKLLDEARKVLENFLLAQIGTPEEAATRVKECITALKPVPDAVVVKAVVGLIVENVEEDLDLSSPASPPLTPTQNRLFALFTAAKRFPSLYSDLLAEVRKKILPEVFFWPDDSIESCARFFAAVCRKMSNRPAALWLCLNALTDMEQRGHIVVWCILHVWSELLPKAELVKPYSLYSTLAFLILQIPPRQRKPQESKRMLLRNMVTQFLGYKFEETKESYVAGVLDGVKNNDHGTVNSLIVIAKRFGWKWAGEKVVTPMISTLSSWQDGDIPDVTATRFLRALKNIICVFPIKDEKAKLFVKNAVSQLGAILYSGKVSPYGEESIVKVILSLSIFGAVHQLLQPWINSHDVSPSLKTAIVRDMSKCSQQTVGNRKQFSIKKKKFRPKN